MELKKAAMEDGTVFDYNHAGTCRAYILYARIGKPIWLPEACDTKGSRNRRINSGQEQKPAMTNQADPVLRP